jgi:hypothetical protein
MIISHQHRFIFFAVPKTATHSIREALRLNIGPEDWEQQMLTGKQTLPIEALARLGHGHISVQQLMPHLSAEVFESYYKFGIVRNPYDRFVSACFFLNRENPSFSARALENMKELIRRPRFRQRLLILPQWQQLCDASATLRMDGLGRYEDLQDSYNDICRKIGISQTDLSVRNSSSHEGFGQYYDEALSALVRQYYKEDFELFEYSKASPCLEVLK